MSAEYSTRHKCAPQQHLSVHHLEQGRPHVKHNYAYHNRGYVGSVTDVGRVTSPTGPPTGVVREQYWACSRWPRGQRMMAVALGVLLGAVIGLGISMGLRAATQEPILGPVLRASAADH